MQMQFRDDRNSARETLLRRRGVLRREHLSHVDSTATRNLFVSGENAEGNAFFSLGDSTAVPSRRGKRERILDLFGYTFPLEIPRTV